MGRSHRGLSLFDNPRVERDGSPRLAGRGHVEGSYPRGCPRPGRAPLRGSRAAATLKVLNMEHFAVHARLALRGSRAAATLKGPHPRMLGVNHLAALRGSRAAATLKVLEEVALRVVGIASPRLAGRGHVEGSAPAPSSTPRGPSLRGSRAAATVKVRCGPPPG